MCRGGKLLVLKPGGDCPLERILIFRLDNVWWELVPPGDSSWEIRVLSSIDRANYVFERLSITPSVTSMWGENILCRNF